MENERSSDQMLRHVTEAQSNIKVPMSEQSAVPLTDTALQLNDPASQSSPVQTDEEEKFCDKPSMQVIVRKDNQHWYIARCSRTKRSVKPLYEELLRDYPQIELYWPQKTEKKGDDSKELSITPVLNEYLFLRADLKVLSRVFRDKHIVSLGYLMNRTYIDGSVQYAIVKDNEMLKFRWICDNHFNSIIVIDKQTTQLRDGLRVRVTDGLLKGKEGVIYRYKGSRSFAVRFDGVFSDEAGDASMNADNTLPFSEYISFRVTKSLQDNLEVIGDDAKTKNLYSVMALVDMLQSYIRNITDENNERPYLFTSGHYANLLILHRLYHSPLLSSDLLKKFRWINRESGTQEKSTRTNKLKPKEYILKDESVVFPELAQINKIIHSLKDFHVEALDFLVQYAMMNLERDLTSFTRPTLSDILLQGHISPFITYDTSHSVYETLDSRLCSSSVEHVLKIDVDEMDNSVRKTLFTSYYSQQTEGKSPVDYYAHIGIFRMKDGGYTLITNWSSFQDVIEKYRSDMLDDKPENVNKRRSMDKMPVFGRVLRESDPAKVSFGTYGDIYGTMIHVSENLDAPDDNDILPAIVQQNVQHLTEVSIAILQEIWSGTQYELRKNLPKVWIRSPKASPLTPISSFY